MTLPPIANEPEALDLIDRICTDESLEELIQRLSRKDEIQRNCAFLGDAISRLHFNERRQAADVLESWQKASLGADQIDPERSYVDVLTNLKTRVRGWDFRLGRERDAIPTSIELLPPDIEVLVYTLAESWGMTGQQPVSGTFQVVAPIGGLVRANIARPATAAALIAEGLIDCEYVVGLASLRRTSEAERLLAIEMGVPSESEEQALKFGLEQAFTLDPACWEKVDELDDLLANSSGSIRTIMASAPRNAETGIRATTGEAFSWLLRAFHLPIDSAILQITTNIYWIANQISLRMSTPREMKVQTTGQRPDLHRGPAQVFRSQHYLQEIKAVIDALPDLWLWANSKYPHDC